MYTFLVFPLDDECGDMQTYIEIFKNVGLSLKLNSNTMVWLAFLCHFLAVITFNVFDIFQCFYVCTSHSIAQLICLKSQAIYTHTYTLA